MSPNEWGPPIWILFHTLAEKIKEENFTELGPQIFNIIKRICSNLPCPDCSLHATIFLSKVNFSHIKTKTDFKHLMYIFHNVVNKKNKKSLYNVVNLSKYANANLISTFNNFVSKFHTRGNMKLLADSFQRKIIVTEFKKWFMTNYKYFDK